MTAACARYLLIVACAMFGATRLTAQVAPLGERVRVTTGGDARGVVIGQVVHSTPDTLTVQPDRDASLRAIPVARITRLEMSGGPYRYALVGAGTGAGIGSSVGGVIGLARTPDPECGNDDLFCTLTWSDVRPTIVGMVTGALIGAAIGGAIGHAMGSDHWIERSLGMKVALYPAAHSSGVSVGFAF